jgi:hypothetical protein
MKCFLLPGVSYCIYRDGVVSRSNQPQSRADTKYTGTLTQVCTGNYLWEQVKLFLSSLWQWYICVVETGCVVSHSCMGQEFDPPPMSKGGFCLMFTSFYLASIKLTMCIKVVFNCYISYWEYQSECNVTKLQLLLLRKLLFIFVSANSRPKM